MIACWLASCEAETTLRSWRRCYGQITLALEIVKDGPGTLKLKK
jgi:hypothetical protein